MRVRGARSVFARCGDKRVTSRLIHDILQTVLINRFPNASRQRGSRTALLPLEIIACLSSSDSVEMLTASMNTLRCFMKSSSSRQVIRTQLMVVLAAFFALAFWFVITPASLAGSPPTNDCTVCHKRTQTILLGCSSLDNRRHLDHGDPATACPSSLVASERDKFKGNDKKE